MDLDLYKRVIDEAVSYGVKKVSIENFGETFLDPTIFEKAAYARERGLKTLTITNASLIDDEYAKRILDNFDVIRMSIYGMTKEVYEGIHVKLKYDVIHANVDRLIEMRNSRKDSNTRIEIYFLLMDENEHELQMFLDKYETRVAGVSVWRPHNWGDGREFRNITEKKISCGRPFVGPLQVQWDGKVVPCCYDYNNQIVLGDLNKQTIQEVMSGDKYKALRKAHDEGDFEKFPFCNGCDQLNKRDDVLVYSNIDGVKVGATNTDRYKLD
jgi:radical SAM protein with 4Fe4S-binding SPASM domain